MIKISNKKIFATTVFLVAIIIFSGYMSISPTTHAQVINNRVKANVILNYVAGFNTNAYAISLISEDNTAPSIAGLSKDTIILSLTSAQSRIRATCTFINGNLNMLYLDDYVGPASLNQPAANAITMAQAFLQRYQTYTANAFYGSIDTMLSNVTANTNSTTTIGNVKLQASVFDNGNMQALVWTYVDNNGAPAQMKDIALIYNNGHLESFLDNWQLYQITGTPTVTREQAVTAAMQATNNFSYTAKDANGVDSIVSGFKVVAVSNVTLSYVNFYENTPDHSIRSGSPYVLYPAWYASVCFDKLYPGGVSGLTVWVWADSGNVSSVTPMVWDMASNSATGVASSSIVTTSNSETNQASITPILLPLAILAAGAMTTTYVFCNLSKQHNFKRSWKTSSSKHKTVALSLIFAIILAPLIVPSVSATWKSETYISTAGYVGDDPDFNTQEKTTSVDVGTYIFNDFEYAQVFSEETAFDEAMGNAPHNFIGNTTLNDEANYQPISVFAFGNGYNPVYILSNNGANLTASDLSSLTQYHYNICFAWMWMCTGAGNTVGGQPNFNFATAWTQTSLSDNYEYNGYDYSDISGHCFIGFEGQAPMISSNSFQGCLQPAYQFIEAFYDAAKTGATVHDSLNIASAVFGVQSYDSTPLPLPGYWAWWPGGDMGGIPMPRGWDQQGAMMVFGDSNIRLVPETVSAPSISGSSDDNTVQINVASTDNYLNNVAYKINWGDGSGDTLYNNNGNDYPSGQSEPFEYSYSSGGLYTITVWAESSTGVWSSSNTLTINVGNDPTYTTTINCYLTWGGDPDYANYMGSYTIQLPYGSNYLDFTNNPYGAYFMYAYDYADSSWHYSSADWYWTGDGTSIDVLWTY